VLAALESTGQLENTVIAFVADHGEYLGAHHLLYKDLWPYEELARVPFVWRVPGGRAAEASDGVVCLLDLAPTVLDFAGVDPVALDMRKTDNRSGSDVLPGRSLRPWLTGEASLGERPALIEYDEDHFNGRICRSRVLVTDRFKLGVYGGTGEGYLFDLHDDPHETRSLWQDPASAGIRADLTHRLLDELARTDRFDGERYCGA